jgi:hypothetical protein
MTYAEKVIKNVKDPIEMLEGLTAKWIELPVECV